MLDEINLPGKTPRSLSLHDCSPQSQPGGEGQSSSCIGENWKETFTVGFLRIFLKERLKILNGKYPLNHYLQYN